MYFYCFDNNRTINIYQSHHKSQTGDIIFYNHKYYLNLWETLSRPEQWTTPIHFDKESIIKWLCTTKTIELLHWMVDERFSSYNKCIPLFFWDDINLLLKHKKTASLTKKNKEPQSLIIFPSVFSLMQYNHNHNKEEIIILSGQSTNISRAKAYRSMHNNEIQILYATHSQIFQDRYDLKSITIIDEYSPQYQTYQDPRYNINTVIKKMKDIYMISNN